MQSIANIIEMGGFIALGAIIATPLLLLNIRVAPALGLIDWPKARGLAEDQIPIVGPALVLISIAAMSVLNHFFDMGIGILPTSIVMAIMGHFDDRKPLSALDKIFFQVLCAIFVVFCDPLIRNSIGAQYGAFGYFLAFFFIVALINAINFIDGIDGLAGIVLVAGAAGLIAFTHGIPDYYPFFLYASLLIGTLVPFLYLNVVKRKGFLGNVGSYFFSYVLVTMHLCVKLPAPDPVARICVVALCFLVPLSDSTMVIFSRMLTFRSPFQADKGHLHHRMVQTSVPLRFILLCFGIVEVVGLTSAYLVNRTPGVYDSFIPHFMCVSFVMVTAGLILFTEKASKRRIQNFLQRLDDGKPLLYFRYEIKTKSGEIPSATLLRRLEAKVSAEIRINDVCFYTPPNRLFVCFSTQVEPVRGIQTRLENIFQAENVEIINALEQGDIIRVSTPSNPSKKGITRPASLRRKAS